MKSPARAIGAATVAIVLLLSGCSSDSSPDATADPSASVTTFSDADLAAAESIVVTGEPGAQPVIEAAPDVTVTYTTPLVLDEGTGETIGEGNLVTFTGVQVQLADGAVVTSAWPEDGGDPTPAVVPVNSTYFGDLTETVANLKVGARLLLVAPATDGTFVAGVYDFTATAPARATGEAVPAVDGLPTVTLAEDGTPSISIPEGYAAPTDLISQTLIEGTGDVVEAGDNVLVQYSGWTFDGEQFDSSWASGSPFEVSPIGSGMVIDGWDQGLVGHTVGSQVLLVIPVDLAYGEPSDTNTSTLAGEPLIFVVDILAVS